MKKFSVVLVGLMMSVGVCATASAAAEITGDAYVGVYDKYLCNGFDLSGGQPVVQGGVDIYAGAFTFSWWANMQLKSDDGAGYQSGEVNENDFTINYSYDPCELVSLNIGNSYYQMDGWDDTNELYLKVGLNTPLNPTLVAYYDWDEAEEDGLFYTLSIGHEIAVAQPLTLSLGALISYNQSNDYSYGDYNEFHNYELSVAVNYVVTDQVSVGASFLFSEGVSDEARDIIDSETLSGVSVILFF